MKKLLSDNIWWSYFILTYPSSWPVWALGNLFFSDNLTIITIIAGAFGSFITALIMLRITGGF